MNEMGLRDVCCYALLLLFLVNTSYSETLTSFAPLGTFLNVEFDEPTKQPKLDCSQIFLSTSTFGTSPLCLWTDGYTLSIFLASDATVLPGDTLIFNSGLFNLQNNSTKVSFPLEPLIPLPSFSIPYEHNPCIDLVIDSRASLNSGGRNFIIEWQIEPALKTSIPLNTPVLTFASESLTTYFDLDTTYVFTLTLTNFLGYTSEPLTQLLSFVQNTPVIRAYPSNLWASRMDSILITTSIQSLPDSCNMQIYDDDDLVYTWTGLPFEVPNSPILSIPSNTLVNGTYYAQLSSRLVSAPYTVFTTTITTISIISRMPQGSIVGGDRLHPLNYPLSLTLQLVSYNGVPDELYKVDWIIVDTVTNEIAFGSGIDGYVSGIQATVPPSRLYPGKFQVCGLVLSRETGEILLEPPPIYVTTQGFGPSVDISVDFTGGNGVYTSEFDSISFIATIKNSDKPFTKCLWSVVHGDLVTYESTYGWNSTTLIVARTSLPSHGVIIFEIEVETIKGVGKSSYRLSMDDFPQLGDCDIDTVSGDSFVTPFVITCHGFESTHYPLRYSVDRKTSFNLPDSTNDFADQFYVGLSWHLQSANTLEFILPDGCHAVRVTIFGSTQRRAFTKFFYGVCSIASTPRIIAEIMEDLIYTSELNDYSMFLQYASFVSEIIDSYGDGILIDTTENEVLYGINETLEIITSLDTFYSPYRPKLFTSIVQIFYNIVGQNWCDCDSTIDFVIRKYSQIFIDSVIPWLRIHPISYESASFLFAVASSKRVETTPKMIDYLKYSLASSTNVDANALVLFNKPSHTITSNSIIVVRRDSLYLTTKTIGVVTDSAIETILETVGDNFGDDLTRPYTWSVVIPDLIVEGMMNSDQSFIQYQLNILLPTSANSTEIPTIFTTKGLPSPNSTFVGLMGLHIGTTAFGLSTPAVYTFPLILNSTKVKYDCLSYDETTSSWGAGCWLTSTQNIQGSLICNCNRLGHVALVFSPVPPAPYVPPAIVNDGPVLSKGQSGGIAVGVIVFVVIVALVIYYVAIKGARTQRYNDPEPSSPAPIIQTPPKEPEATQAEEDHNFSTSRLSKMSKGNSPAMVSTSTTRASFSTEIDLEHQRQANKTSMITRGASNQQGRPANLSPELGIGRDRMAIATRARSSSSSRRTGSTPRLSTSNIKLDPNMGDLSDAEDEGPVSQSPRPPMKLKAYD
eukprot:TRINITY_DN1377_c0_g1_i4.p1 TRINITY_DN1377_c0_g1~~TRINITY_DN1377_c0_g1_i4.p1  ORF type:complete len:1191 (-),score=253.26 TRINITY_DN1377_c0_g1_i4:71-3643(-)